MEISLAIFFTSTLLTFIYGVWKRKSNKKKDDQFMFRVKDYYLHHSLLGLFLLFLPLFKLGSIWIYIGLGIIIGHGFEEIYLGDKNLKTFLTFLSK